MAEDKVSSRISLFELFKRLAPYFVKHWKLATIVGFSILSLNVVARLLPTVFGWAVDFGIYKKDMNFVTKMAFIYLGLEVARSFFTFFHAYLFERLGNRILFEIRERVISHVQSLPIEYFDKNPIGRIVTRVTNDVQGLTELFNQGLVNIITNIIGVISIVIAMMLISVKLTVIALITAPLVYFALAKISRKILIVFRQAKGKLAEINAFVAENINGMKVIQIYNRAKKNQEQFVALSEGYRRTQIRAVSLYAMLWPLLNFFNAATIAAALYFGGFLQAEGELAIGVLIAFLMHIQDFHPPLNNILERYIQFQNSLTSAERIFTLLDQKPEELGQGDLAPIHGRMEFKDLSFRYAEHLPWALNQVSLKINAGESIAVVGATGSGKSTMIALLQRFYDYQNGDILIDGRSLKDIPRRLLRRQIGVVQQDPFMFRGTIAENIHLNDSSVSQLQVEQAVRLSRCDSFVSKYDKGLKAMIEERGNNLSTGEKQLIAFARILAFDPKILILDEATANIDSASEQIIQKATKEVTKNRTSIIIAHRLSTILDCDRIVVLEKGRIKEVGSHEELLQKRGMYYNLYTSQTRSENLTPSIELSQV